MLMHRIRSVLFAGFVLVVASGVRSAEPDAGPQGLRVFTCGHSFHSWVAPILLDLATKAGISGHQIAGVSSIGGSRVIQHWDVPLERNKARLALTSGQVDVLTLSPIWLPDDGIEKFAVLGFEHNPAIRVTVQEFWLPNDTYHPVYPLETRKPVDHNSTNLAELRRQNGLYEHDIEAKVLEINQQLGRTVVFVVPVGEAAIELREAIVAGKALPLKVQWNLFVDNWGHPTAPLRVLASYCHFAVIYRRTPVGLPMPDELTKSRFCRSSA